MSPKERKALREARKADPWYQPEVIEFFVGKEGAVALAWPVEGRDLSIVGCDDDNGGFRTWAEYLAASDPNGGASFGYSPPANTRRSRLNPALDRTLTFERDGWVETLADIPLPWEPRPWFWYGRLQTADQRERVRATMRNRWIWLVGQEALRSRQRRIFEALAQAIGAYQEAKGKRRALLDLDEPVAKVLEQLARCVRSVRDAEATDNESRDGHYNDELSVELQLLSYLRHEVEFPMGVGLESAGTPAPSCPFESWSWDEAPALAGVPGPGKMPVWLVEDRGREYRRAKTEGRKQSDAVSCLAVTLIARELVEGLTRHDGMRTLLGMSLPVEM